jgi:hypothetical protein
MYKKFQNRPILAHFGPFWPILAHFGTKSRFSQYLYDRKSCHTPFLYTLEVREKMAKPQSQLLKKYFGGLVHPPCPATFEAGARRPAIKCIF